MNRGEFPDLGVGVGLRPTHYSEFLSPQGPPPEVGWVEVITENYLPWVKGQDSSRSLQVLEKVRNHLPVVLHGVSLSLGSTDPLNLDYLKRWKELIQRVQPAWVSDHLCWTGVNGENLHDLLPLPYTEEVVKWVVDRILRVQDFLGRRMLIENLSTYVEFKQSEMTEWEFLSEITRRADCGVLLDINNVYVSSVNHGFDPKEYLRAISREQVGQVHIAGHRKKTVRRNGRVHQFLVDTHDEPVSEEVWALYEWSLKRFGRLSTMIERDDNIPKWTEMGRELQRIESIRLRAVNMAAAAPVAPLLKDETQEVRHEHENESRLFG